MREIASRMHPIKPAGPLAWASGWAGWASPSPFGLS